MASVDVFLGRRGHRVVGADRLGGGDAMVMEPKNPMEVLSDAELMAEFKMEVNFINRHAKEMGSRGRPRKFLRMNVERFVAVYFNDQLMEKLAKKAEALRVEELFQSLSAPVLSDVAVPAISGRILGRGGKVRQGLEVTGRQGAKKGASA